MNWDDAIRFLGLLGGALIAEVVVSYRHRPTDATSEDESPSDSEDVVEVTDDAP